MVTVLSTVESQLRKKASFEEGVKALDIFFSETYSHSDDGLKKEALRLLGRAHALLKSRYTSLAFWRVGQALFLTALANVTASADDFKRVSEYVESAESVLTEAEGATGSTPLDLHQPLRDQAALFEGQLSQQPDGPTPNPPVDVSALLAHLMAAGLGNQPHSEESFFHSDADNTVQSSEGQREASNEAQSTTEGVGGLADQMRQIQERIMEALEATNTGMESVLAGMERVEQGVQDVLHAIGGEEAESIGPPAAKIVVESLPRKKLVDDDLATLGKDTTCPVCMEPLKCGDVMTALPCKHVFHLECLEQWLRMRNSCPLCRHELPTDDREYELRKEREEERRGAANALSHNEFMYI